MILNNKGKASTIVIGILIVASIIIGIAFVYTSNTGTDAALETVSKKVKLDLKDKATETAPTSTAQKAVTPSAVAQSAKIAEKQTPKEALKPLIAAKASEAPVKKDAAKPAEPLKAEVKSTTVKEASKPQTAKASASAPSVKTNLLNKPWVVNLASFISDREAQEFKKSLKKAGYNAYVTSVNKDELTWYRVRAGFFKTEADAKKAAKNIAGKFKLESEPWITKPTRAEISKHSK